MKSLLLLAAAAVLTGCAGIQPAKTTGSIVGAESGAAVHDGYEPDTAYVEQVVGLAQRAQLWRDEGWQRLGHYHGGLRGKTSQADGPAFFVSPQGRDDAAAELVATVRAFFAVPRVDDEHALCRFPARRRWLQRQLGLDEAKLTRVDCAAYERYLQRAGAQSVSVIFSSYYLNNPASMFGHTFLRFNRQLDVAQEERRPLLDQGLDYSASVPPNENQIVFTFRGLAGLYPGIFRMLPYYYKVREYNDSESRDLWEYDLSLDPAQSRQVADHIWEIGHTYFDYYYLDENCSYHVLAALEVADPHVHLLDQISWPVIPADTIKAVVASPGLVKQVRYRPSAKSTFRARVSLVRPELLSLVAHLGTDATTPLPAGLSPEDAGLVLDAAIDYVEMVHAREILADERESVGATLKQRLLERRAEVDAETPDLVVRPPEQEMPHKGHGSSRLALGVGAYDLARGGRPAEGFLQLEHRMALHDLSDAPAGYPQFSQIEFLPFRLRYQLVQERLRFEDASLLRVVSLNPIDRFNLRPSYKIRVGATTFRDDRCAECTLGAGEVGGGLAMATARGVLTGWVMGEMGVYGIRFAGRSDDAVRWQVGPSAGVRVQLHPRLIALGTGGVAWLPVQDSPRRVWEANAVVRWHPFASWSMALEGRLQPRSSQALFSSAFYF